MNQGRVQDKVAVITGGAKGIGRATAIKMVNEGAPVALLDILFERASHTAKELQAWGGKAVAIRTDVTRKKEVHTAIEQVLTQWSRVDILVNNAGVVKPALLKDVHEGDWDRSSREPQGNVLLYPGGPSDDERTTVWKDH